MNSLLKDHLLKIIANILTNQKQLTLIEILLINWNHFIKLILFNAININDVPNEVIDVIVNWLNFINLNQFYINITNVIKNTIRRINNTFFWQWNY